MGRAPCTSWFTWFIRGEQEPDDKAELLIQRARRLVRRYASTAFAGRNRQSQMLDLDSARESGPVASRI